MATPITLTAENADAIRWGVLDEVNHYLEALVEQVPQLRDELDVPDTLQADAESNAAALRRLLDALDRIGWRATDERG